VYRTDVFYFETEYIKIKLLHFKLSIQWRSAKLANTATECAFERRWCKLLVSQESLYIYNINYSR